MDHEAEVIARWERQFRDQQDQIGKLYSLLHNEKTEKEVLKMRVDQHEKFIWGLVSIVLVSVAARLLALV